VIGRSRVNTTSLEQNADGLALRAAAIPYWRSRCNAVPEVFVRNFAIALAANVEEHVTIFYLEELTLSVHDVNRHVERLEKSFVISALALVSHD